MSRISRENSPVFTCTAMRDSSCNAATVSGFDSSRKLLSSSRTHRNIDAAGADVDVNVAVQVADIE